VRQITASLTAAEKEARLVSLANGPNREHFDRVKSVRQAGPQAFLLLSETEKYNVMDSMARVKELTDDGGPTEPWKPKPKLPPIPPPKPRAAPKVKGVVASTVSAASVEAQALNYSQPPRPKPQTQTQPKPQIKPQPTASTAPAAPVYGPDGRKISALELLLAASEQRAASEASTFRVAVPT